ncbi:MAG: efflux RND transporter periplasmic adaptor subunit [Granulosicoccus sp.]
MVCLLQKSVVDERYTVTLFGKIRLTCLEFNVVRASTLAAAGIVLVLALWMGSGLLSSDDSETTVKDDEQSPAMTVEVQVVEPTAMNREITLQGQLNARRHLLIRAETSGVVESLSIKKGARVSVGDELLVLDKADRESDLEEARAQVRSAQSEQTAANSLKRQGLQSQLQLEQASAALAAATARLARIERDLANTRIIAPFAGIVNDVTVEAGELVELGQSVAELFDTSGFKVRAHAAQQSIAELHVGQTLQVELITGESMDGKLSWISAVADNASRSFAIEAEIDNPANSVAAGVSATLRIPVEKIEAAFITPSALSLGDDGELGVKIVDENNHVVFVPIDIVRTSIDGAWVTGIASGSRLIVLGQGFVNTGERVETRESEKRVQN